MKKESEAILHFAYHNGGLEVTFTNRRTYRYDAPATVYYYMKGATSKGSFFNRRVRGKYPCYEVELLRAVDLERKVRALATHGTYAEPEIDYCGDVIIIDRRPHGDGAEAAATYFMKRTEKWIRKLDNEQR